MGNDDLQATIAINRRIVTRELTMKFNVSRDETLYKSNVTISNKKKAQAFHLT